MELSKLFEVLIYCVPAIITGIVAFYFFKVHTENEEKKMKIALLKEQKKHTLPIQLQAYERMTLFLERMNPSKLLIRINSINNDKTAYAQSLLNTIEQEFEHNIAQQIYISDKCWNVIIASKNATSQIIKKTAELESIETAQELREAILKRILETSAPSTTALAFIKNEVNELL
jgi:hypothetical protein